MTEEEINNAIAKACGWTNIRELDDIYPDGSVAAGVWWQGVPPASSELSGEQLILDYCNDREAIYKAIIHWLDTKKSEYERNESAALLEIAILREMKDDKFVTQSSYLATSKQLATAFLKTFNLTKESK